MPETYPPSNPHPHSLITNYANSTVIVGLSGGPDSIYLLHYLYRYKQSFAITIIAAHLDHEWQESSKIAAQLCQDACDSLGITLVIRKISQLPLQPKWNGSQEELGRTMRRYFFTTLAEEYQASAIALAHHQQDQHETFFIRLLRGSSLTGLTGMQEQDGLFIRPILTLNKQEILAYLNKNAIAYYIDPTNCSDDYLRNRIRNHVTPALYKADARSEQNLTATMHQLTLVEDFLCQQTAQTIAAISTTQGIHLTSFLQLHQVIQQRILLQAMITADVSFTPSQKMFKEMMRFLEKSTANKHSMHTSWLIEKNRSYFAIKKIKKIDKTL